MPTFTRRDWLRLSTLAMAAAARPLRAQARPLKMLLNSGFSGANAFFLLAQDKGYFKEGGLDLVFTTGAGAYTAPERMMKEGFDVGYGDVNALIEAVSRDPRQSPVAVYMVFNNSPSVLVVKAGGRVELPYDLVGRKLVGHSTDVALNTFGIFAALARIDPQEMTISTTDASMATMLKDLVAGKTDAVFGYNSTIRAAAAAEKINPDKDLKFFKYRRPDQRLLRQRNHGPPLAPRRIAAAGPRPAPRRHPRPPRRHPAAGCRDGRAGETRSED